MNKQVGRFKLSVYTDGWPASINIQYQRNQVIKQKIELDENDIDDLEYLVSQAKKELDERKHK